MKRAFARWLPLAKYLIGAGLLILVITSGHIRLRDLAGSLDRWPWLLAGLFGVVGVFSFGICRWWVLLRSQGIQITFWKTLQVSFIGYFFNTVMPGSVGGDLVKAYYVARDREGQRVEAISTIMLDRLIGLFALVSIGALAAVLFPSVGFGTPRFKMLSQFVLACLAGGAVVVVLFLWVDLRQLGPFRKENPGRILGAIRRLYNCLWLYREKKRVLALALLLSFCAHSFGVSLMVALAQSLGGQEGMTAARYLFVIPLGYVINGLPIAPGGWGLGEYAYSLLFREALGKAENIGASLALLMHFAFTFWNLVGFLFYVGHRREVQEARLLAEGEGEP